MEENEIKIDQLRLITLLNKTPALKEDLEEILTYAKEDIETFFGGVSFHLGEQIVEGEFILKVVVGDLQGLPEIFLTRAPTADDVIRSTLFFLRIFQTLNYPGLWLLQYTKEGLGEI